MGAEFLDVYQDKVILVTGGAGAIGTNLCAALSNAGRLCKDLYLSSCKECKL